MASPSYLDLDPDSTLAFSRRRALYMRSRLTILSGTPSTHSITPFHRTQVQRIEPTEGRRGRERRERPTENRHLATCCNRSKGKSSGSSKTDRPCVAVVCHGPILHTMRSLLCPRGGRSPRFRASNARRHARPLYVRLLGRRGGACSRSHPTSPTQKGTCRIGNDCRKAVAVLVQSAGSRRSNGAGGVVSPRGRVAAGFAEGCYLLLRGIAEGMNPSFAMDSGVRKMSFRRFDVKDRRRRTAAASGQGSAAAV